MTKPKMAQIPYGFPASRQFASETNSIQTASTANLCLFLAGLAPPGLSISGHIYLPAGSDVDVIASGGIDMRACFAPSPATFPPPVEWSGRKPGQFVLPRLAEGRPDKLKEDQRAEPLVRLADRLAGRPAPNYK